MSTDRVGQITGWILAVVLAAGAGFIASRWGEQTERQNHRQAVRTLDQAARDARAAAGPVISSRSMLDDRTELVRIDIPDPTYGDPILDARCLLVRDLELRAVTLTCPTGFDPALAR